MTDESVFVCYFYPQGPLRNTCGHFWLMIWEQKTKAMAIGVVGKVKVGKNDHRAPDVKFKIVDRPSVFSDQPSSPAVVDAAAESLPASAAPEPSPSADKVDEWAEFEAA